MAYPSPQAAAPAPISRSRPGRAGTVVKNLADILWLPLLVLFGFLACYLLAFHAPAPHGVKVAVAGPVSVTQLSAGLQQEASDAFNVIPVADAGQARQQVLDQAAQAAYAVAGGQATLYTAKADGAILEQTVIKAFTPIASTEHLSLRTVELAPTVPGDVTGISLFYLGLALDVAPSILVLQLMTQATTLNRRGKLAIIVGLGAFAGIAAFLIAYGLGAVPSQSLAMLYGFLTFEAIALTVFGLVPFLGWYALGVGLILFVFLSAPASGGAVPYQMVPTFFRWLHPILPLGNLIDAMRSIFYFDGTNMIRPTLVLCTWIAVGAALVAVSALRQRARQRQAPALARTAAGPVGELPGPAPAVMEPSAIQAPADHAMLAGNGADGFGPCPPVLFGRVTEAVGGPVPGANITIIDADGHQLLRTSTDRNGRYAADGLPDGVLTVLLSPVGRMPVATRVVLAGDLPARQDLVLPDPMQGTRRDASIFYGT